MVSRSVGGWRTWRASPSISAAARPTSRSGRRGSVCSSAMITRVGDEHMGRFIREQCAREGVDTERRRHRPAAADRPGDPGHPGQRHLPADLLSRELRRMRAEEDDIDEELIAEAAAVLVTGTHFSSPQLDAASRRAMRLAQDAWRPRGTGHRLPARPLGPHRPRGGEARFVASDRVTASCSAILPHAI